MGNRANYAIVKDQDWRLYYSHWAGCRMLGALIGGPELALRYAQSPRHCGKTSGPIRCAPTAARLLTSIAAGCCCSVTS